MKKKLVLRISAAVVGCLLVGGLGVGAYAYKAPAAYVSMDVNPSIEYTLNMFDRVLSVNAVNEDGAKILQEVNLKDFNNKTIDEAIRLTLDEITAKGYFDGNAPGGIVIAASGKEPLAAGDLAARLESLVVAQCAENNRTVSVESMGVDAAQMDEAKALGVTPGKLLLVRELQSETPAGTTFVTEEWLTKSVREIMAEVQRVDAIEDAAEDAADKAEDELDAKKDAAEAEEDAAEDKAEEAESLAEAAKDAAEDKADQEKDAAEQAEDLAQEAEETAADAAEEAAEKAEEAKETAEENEKTARDTVKEQAEKAAEEAEEAAEAAEEAAEAAEDKEEPEEAPAKPSKPVAPVKPAAAAEPAPAAPPAQEEDEPAGEEDDPADPEDAD